MESKEEHLKKLREQRLEKEKARIQKLRELNLKKYNKTDPTPSSSSTSLPVKSKSDTSTITKTVPKPEKKNLNLNPASKIPIQSNGSDNIVNKDGPKNNTAPKSINVNKDHIRVPNNNINGINKVSADIKTNKPLKEIPETIPKNNDNNSGAIPKVTQNVNGKIGMNGKNTANSVMRRKTIDTRKSVIQPAWNSAKPSGQYFSDRSQKTNQNGNLGNKNTANADVRRKTLDTRKSMMPTLKEAKPSGESVFDRLYKPKVVTKATTPSIDNASKLLTDRSYLQKIVKDSQLITNGRLTMFDVRPNVSAPVRRSISAVHFKRISKSELGNCVHKWASMGEKINKVNIEDINEDENEKEEIVNAVKSERKKVKFQTPTHMNTPKPEELQRRLHAWLQKRGKSIDSYHHLQCFGLHHLSKQTKPMSLVDDYDDENKENIALEHDSDNESYLENMNMNGNLNGVKEFAANEWRKATSICESEYNESYETSNSDAVHHVEELLLGALEDLTDLLKEGFEWKQCAGWLSAIKERYPTATNKAAYWECMAALQERRGDLYASVDCWEHAIAAGTEQSVVEANLDNLLDKFMQLKISPSCGKRHTVDPKMVDVKNVFKSTIIRFAVQQAKLRQSSEKPKYTVTPVRRSSRLSLRQTPLKVCTTLHQAADFGAEFKPNKALVKTP